MKTSQTITILALVVLGVFAYFLFGKNNTVVNNPPVSGIDTSNWKTSSDSARGLTFKYPETLSTTYINTQDWPPKAQVENGPFSCNPAGQENSVAGQTTLQIINGRQYCVTKETQGAAGSIYTQYAYATLINNKLVFLTFTLRFVQCSNYDEPNKTACENERAAFSIDPIVEGMVKTAQIQ